MDNDKYKICIKCDELLEQKSFKVILGMRGNICELCAKKRRDKNNKDKRQKILDAANGCWWIEIFCTYPINNK
jgi:hypothetical protein